MHTRLVQKVIRPRGAGNTVLGNHFTTRSDQGQIGQAHIVHGAGNAADITRMASADKNNANALKHEKGSVNKRLGE
jgi:hypothetical protein